MQEEIEEAWEEYREGILSYEELLERLEEIEEKWTIGA